MSLTDRLVKYLESAIVVLGLVALVAVVAFIVSSAGTKTYTGQARLVVIAGLGLDRSADILTAPRIAQTYGTLALTTPVLAKVISTLDLDDSTEDLQLRLRVTTEPTTPFITIEATDERPANAQQIANAIADILVDRSTVPAVGTTPEAAILNIVERATLPVEPSGPRVLFNTVLAAAVTFVLATTVVAGVAYLRGGVEPEATTPG